MNYEDFKPVREVPLRKARREKGSLTIKDNQTYEVTRIDESNGQCFGVQIDDLEDQRRGFREFMSGKHRWLP